jgi:hypothetical protein
MNGHLRLFNRLRDSPFDKLRASGVNQSFLSRTSDEVTITKRNELIKTAGIKIERQGMAACPILHAIWRLGA